MGIWVGYCWMLLTGIPGIRPSTQRCARLSKACIRMAYIDRSCPGLRGTVEAVDNITFCCSKLILQSGYRAAFFAFFHAFQRFFCAAEIRARASALMMRFIFVRN